jgi:hypothetical protein
VNSNDYMENSKTFFNLKGTSKEFGDIVTKPDYMIMNKPSKPQPTETHSLISKFNGWVSVNESQKLTRKNAPEIAKEPLSEYQK